MKSGSRPAIAVVIVFLVTWGLTTHGKYSASGDEPHYLMIAESLQADGDLDLANNYAQNDGRLFGHDGLENDGHATKDRRGRLGSLHDIGLPVLVLPVYTVARAVAARVSPETLARFRMNPGLFAYSLVSLAMIGLATWFGGLLLAPLARAFPSGRTDVTWYLIALSPPVISHAFLIFPEVAMFAVACLAVDAACRGRDHRPSFRRLGITALALGTSPWLHRKFSLYAIALLLAVCWMQREQVRTLTARQIAAIVALFVVPFVTLYWWTLHNWGTVLGPQFLRGGRLDVAGIPRGAVGLAADRQAGLLAYAPLYAVLPACLIVAATEYWPLLLAGLCLFLPMSAFDEWWGGFSPAARYLVPLIPVCAVCLARGLQRRRIRWALAALAVPQVVIDAVAWQRPRLLWPQDTGSNVLLDRLGWFGTQMQRLLPDVRHGAPVSQLVGILLVLALVTLLLVARRSSDRPAAS